MRACSLGRAATVGESSKALRVKLFNGLLWYQVTSTCWTPSGMAEIIRAQGKIFIVGGEPPIHRSYSGHRPVD